MRKVVVGSFVFLLPVFAAAVPLEGSVAWRGSPVGGLVLAIALGLALRMARRRHRGA